MSLKGVPEEIPGSNFAGFDKEKSSKIDFPLDIRFKNFKMINK